MASYIELAGVPGVGKTTTYKQLRKIAERRKNFLLYEDLYRVEYVYKNAFKEKIKLLFNTVFKIKEPSSSEFHYEESLLNKFIQHNPEIINRFWASLLECNSGSKDLRFHRVQYMVKIFERIQRVKEDPSKKIFLIDEGLVHNSKKFIGENEYNYEKQIVEFVEKIELPKALIYFGGDADVIAKRTFLRRKHIERDNNLTYSELVNARKMSLKEWQKCLKILRSKQIPILYLDAVETVEAKAEKIFEFINSLQDNNSLFTSIPSDLYK